MWRYFPCSKVNVNVQRLLPAQQFRTLEHEPDWVFLSEVGDSPFVKVVELFPVFKRYGERTFDPALAEEVRSLPAPAFVQEIS